WSKFTKKRKWTPKQGDTLRGVRKAPSPHLRQFAFPDPLKDTPKKDVMDVREVTTDAQIFRHRFESPVMNFFPEFNDLLDHSEAHVNDIAEKIERYEDMFIRGNVFHQSPYIFVVMAGGDVELVRTTPWTGLGAVDSTTDGK